MKISSLFIFLFFFILKGVTQSPLNICTWNVKHLSASKTDSSIRYIANTIKEYDVIALQEVVSGYDGVWATAKLTELLNNGTKKWMYAVSAATSPKNIYDSERYAFIWNTEKISLVDTPWLQKKYSEEISREPFFATFKTGGDSFTLVNFHATTKDKFPETEIKYFKYFLQEYPGLNLIFCGDFNTSQLNSVFNPLKSAGFRPVLQNQKTTLSHFCYNGDCLASEFDNIFFDTLKLKIEMANVIHFYKEFPNRKSAEKISDHLPVYCRFLFHRMTQE